MQIINNLKIKYSTSLDVRTGQENKNFELNSFQCLNSKLLIYFKWKTQIFHTDIHTCVPSSLIMWFLKALLLDYSHIHIHTHTQINYNSVI
jgi:hypothetical protein